MTFGRESDVPARHRMLDAFIEAGRRSWTPRTSTATATVGARKSSVGAQGEGEPNYQGLSRGHTSRSIGNSLHRLTTDYVDLIPVQAWEGGTSPEETLLTLDRLVQDGKVRQLGRALFRLAAAEGGGHRGRARMGGVRQPSGAEQPARPRAGVGARPGQPRRGLRATANELTWDLLDVHDVASQNGRTMERIEANLGWVGWGLDRAQRAALDAASDRPLPYRYATVTADPARV